MKNFYAILKDREVVIVESGVEWARFFEDFANRRVTESHHGDIMVSTVFLGLNHQYEHGPDLWFETMIFGGPNDGYQDRYTTYAQAELGHEIAWLIAKAGAEVSADDIANLRSNIAQALIPFKKESSIETDNG